MRFLRAFVIFLFSIPGAYGSGAAQRILVQWDFQDASAGQTTGFEPSYISSAGVTAGILTELAPQGEGNTVGVVKPSSDQELRLRRLRGSAPYTRALAIGFASTRKEGPGTGSYSVNFHIKMESNWRASTLSSLRFDFGYDTALKDYYSPVSQLYVSRDNEHWAAVGDLVEPNPGESTEGFVDAFYIEPAAAVPLESLGVIQPGETLYFRLAVGEGGPQESSDNRRRILIDNLTILSPAKGSTPQHRIVYQEPGKFAGWPANSGAWSWGDEMLVCFELWGYLERNDNHSIDPDQPSELVFARSLDGGETWGIERHANVTLTVGAEQLVARTAKDFTSPDFAMRMRESYVWSSADRGRSWSQPSWISGQKEWGFQARTSYVITGEEHAFAFITAREKQGGDEDVKRNQSTVWRTRTSGLTYDYVSMMGDAEKFAEVPDSGDAYSIMPSVLRLGKDHYVAAVRELIRRDKWIQIYESKDACESWTPLATLARGAHNPGALLHLGGSRLVMVYGVRETSPRGIYATLSEDAGRTWCEPVILRSDVWSWDFGYPVAFVRPDGAIVAIYYYTTRQDVQQHIAATIWQPPPRKRPLIQTNEQRLIYAFDDNYSVAEDGTPVLTESRAYLPATRMTANGRLSVSFAPLRSEYLYEVQKSTDLSEWTTIERLAGGTPTPQEVETGESTATHPRLFLRVKISEPAE